MKTSLSHKFSMFLTLTGLVFILLLTILAVCWPVTFYFAYAAFNPRLPVFEYVPYAVGIYAPVAALVIITLFGGNPRHKFLGIIAENVSQDEMPDVHVSVTRLASQADVPVPSISFLKIKEPIAFTTGTRQAESTIFFSEGIREQLSESQFNAVLAHEIAHVANRDATVMTLALMPYRILGQTGVALLIGYLSREREFAADRGAVALTGEATSLITALETLHDVKPPTEDFRVRAAVSALSIVDTTTVGVTFGQSDKTGKLATSHRIFRRLLRTHPPLKERRSRLLKLDPDAV